LPSSCGPLALAVLIDLDTTLAELQASYEGSVIRVSACAFSGDGEPDV
jgi:hypothetical protein